MERTYTHCIFIPQQKTPHRDGKTRDRTVFDLFGSAEKGLSFLDIAIYPRNIICTLDLNPKYTIEITNLPQIIGSWAFTAFASMQTPMSQASVGYLAILLHNLGLIYKDMIMNIFDDDDFMMTTPKDNYFSIAKTANENIAQMELEKMLQRLAVAEKILEERGLEEEHENLLKSMVIDKELEDRTNSLFIELVGNIVTQCE
jgi:hypothetical protein